MDEIQAVLDMNISELEKDENELQRDMLLWYYDRWMPVAAGKHWWRDEIKWHKLLTDTQPVGGVPKVNVTITSEAFGFLLYENHSAVWKKQMEYKQKYGPDAPLPKAKDDTDLDGKTVDHYKNKWSNSTTGQVKYGGWDDAAYQKFEAHINWVKGWRETEEANGKPLQKYALKLIQEKNKKKLDKANATKNKRKKKQPTPKPNKAKMPRLDE